MDGRLPEREPMSSTTQLLVRNDQQDQGDGRPRGRGPGTRRPASKPATPADEGLVSITGLVDFVGDNRGFVRTSGYQPGPNDVYLPPEQISTYGLRKGDIITGAARPGRDPKAKSGQRSGSKSTDKRAALVRVDTVSGMSPGAARSRPAFADPTPPHPQGRLRLETEPAVLTTRIVDLVSPIGKGQRGLIVSPPKAG